MSEEEGGCKPFFKGLMNVCEELKPCPFCGATELDIRMNEWTRTWSIVCPNKHTFECVNAWKSEGETIKEWNRRAGDEELLEFAVFLIQEGITTVGRAADLARMSYYEFEDELRKRGVRWKE